MIIDYGIPQINNNFNLEGSGGGSMGIFFSPDMTVSVV